MLTLAAFRYRNALVRNGGPIRALQVARSDASPGAPFQANAWLRAGLGPASELRSIYGTCHGTGTHWSAPVACFIAISEALERWAFHATEASADRARFGFDLDPTSNGMAAFPGFTRRAARRRALSEAIERASLFDWWEGRADGRRAPTDEADVAGVRIENPFGIGVTAVTWREFSPGWFSYGHGAADTWRAACARAVVEMNRGAKVLERYRERSGSGNAGLPADPFERRCLFFASTEGHEVFLSRVRRGASAATRTWAIAFDGEIKGPWTKYTTVWRVVIPPATRDYLDADERYFFW